MKFDGIWAEEGFLGVVMGVGGCERGIFGVVRGFGWLMGVERFEVLLQC